MRSIDKRTQNSPDISPKFQSLVIVEQSLFSQHTGSLVGHRISAVYFSSSHRLPPLTPSVLLGAGGGGKGRARERALRPPRRRRNRPSSSITMSEAASCNCTADRNVDKSRRRKEGRRGEERRHHSGSGISSVRVGTSVISEYKDLKKKIKIIGRDQLKLHSKIKDHIK